MLYIILYMLHIIYIIYIKNDRGDDMLLNDLTLRYQSYSNETRFTNTYVLPMLQKSTSRYSIRHSYETRFANTYVLPRLLKSTLRYPFEYFGKKCFVPEHQRHS